MKLWVAKVILRLLRCVVKEKWLLLYSVIGTSLQTLGLILLEKWSSMLPLKLYGTLFRQLEECWPDFCFLFWKGYRNCQDRYNAGFRSSALYEIDVYGNGSFLSDIWCDFSTGRGINVAGDGSRPILAAWSCMQIKTYFPGVSWLTPDKENNHFAGLDTGFVWWESCMLDLTGCKKKNCNNMATLQLL